MSQERLGELCGKSFQTISRYENSDEPLPEDFLKAAAKALDVTVEALQVDDAELHEAVPEYRGKVLSLKLLTRDELIGKLNQFAREVSANIPENNDDRLVAIAAISEELRRRPVNSKSLSALEESALASSLAAKQSVQESSPTQKAVAPSGDKPAPGGGAGKGSK